MDKVRYSSNAIISIEDDEVLISFNLHGHQYYIQPSTFSPQDGVLLGKIVKDDKDIKQSLKEVIKFKSLYGKDYGLIASLRLEGNFLAGKMGDKSILGFFLHGWFELYDMNVFFAKSNEYAKTIKKRSDKLYIKLRRAIVKLI